MYVSPSRLVLSEEEEFCTHVAGVSVDLYNEFLKTM